jgi:hypothetical protein
MRTDVVEEKDVLSTKNPLLFYDPNTPLLSLMPSSPRSPALSRTRCSVYYKSSIPIVSPVDTSLDARLEYPSTVFDSSVCIKVPG